MPTVVWSFEGDTKDLDRALALINADVKQGEGEFKKLGESGSKEINRLAVSAERAKKALAGGLATGLTASVAGAVALSKATIDLSARLDNAAKQAKRVSSTAEDVQVLRQAFGLAGVESQTLDSGLEKLRVNLGKAADGTGEQADALTALGLTSAALEKIPLPERLAVIGDAMKGVASEGKRSEIAVALFGGAGRDLVPVLEQGGAALRDAMEQVRGFGVSTNEAAAASEVLQDQIALAEQAIQAGADTATAAFIPAMTDLAVAVQDVAKAAARSGLPEYVAMLGDVVSGAVLAARAIGLLGLAEQNRSAESRTAARAEIDRQSDRVASIRAELKAAEAFDRLLSTAQGQKVQSEQTKDLTAELERQLGVLRRLRGELGAEAGLVDQANALTAQAAGRTTSTDQPPAGPAAKAAAASPSVRDAVDAVTDYRKAWEEARSALDAAGAAVDDVLNRQLDASARLVKAKEAEEARIVDLVNRAVSGTGVSEEAKLELVRRGHEARLALEEQLQRDLAALAVEEVARTDATVSAMESAWRSFRGAWNDGLGEMLNAVVGAAAQIVGTFAGMAQDVMNERVAAAEETESAIRNIERTMVDVTDDAEREKLQGRVDALRAMEREQKKSALEAFRVSKALSIVQAGMQTALAVVNAIATAPNIIAGLVLAGVAATLGGVQIGIIAAKQPPTFHSGGVLRASDVAGANMDRVPVMAKPGEGFLSTTGVAAAGGPAGVDALNAGRGGGWGGATYNIIRLGTRTTEVIAHEQLRSRTGRMAQEFRSVRPRVGRSFPGRR